MNDDMPEQAATHELGSCQRRARQLSHFDQTRLDEIDGQAQRSCALRRRAVKPRRESAPRTRASKREALMSHKISRRAGRRADRGHQSVARRSGAAGATVSGVHACLWRPARRARHRRRRPRRSRPGDHSQSRGGRRDAGGCAGSTRDKPDVKYCQEIFKVLKAHAIDTFLYIGGNDSSDTVRIVAEEAKKGDHDRKAIHIPKTIDNDLVGFDHTPGFPSAARFVVQAFMGANLDNSALPGVYCAVVMGRHAGFLTAASALARKFPGDGPHLIYLPERTFVLDEFLGDVKASYEKHGRCIIAAYHFKESEVIDISKAAGFLHDNIKKILDEKRTRRNIAAHPSLVEITQYQAEDFISDLVNNVILRLT